MWLKLVAVFVVCGVFVQCELDRRDVHRIILKPERAKKTHKKHHHSSKNHHKPHHHHHDSDYEPQALSSNYFSEETTYYHDKLNHKPHHKYHNHHEEYHELTKPRPPHRESNYFSYPEEDKYPSKHFRKDLKEIWSPLPSKTVAVTRKPPTTFDYQHQQRNHSKKSRRKTTAKPPSLSEIVDITTNKPRKYPIPLLTSNQFEPHFTEQKPSSHFEPHFSEQKTSSHFEPHFPEQKPTNHFEPLFPEKKPSNHFEPHFSEQKPTNHFEPHFSGQKTTSHYESQHYPEQQKSRITPESLIPKDFEIGGEHSYEVHEDFFEQKTTRPPAGSYANVSPLMGNYLQNLKTPQPFLPTTVPFLSAGMYSSNSDDFGLRTRNLQKSF